MWMFLQTLFTTNIFSPPCCGESEHDVSSNHHLPLSIIQTWHSPGKLWYVFWIYLHSDLWLWVVLWRGIPIQRKTNLQICIRENVSKKLLIAVGCSPIQVMLTHQMKVRIVHLLNIRNFVINMKHIFWSLVINFMWVF
jgi:hypothetical protein